MQKHLILLAAALVFTGKLAAQQDTVRTLLHPAKMHHIGFYVAPEAQFGQAGGAFTGFGGGSAMLVFNNRFALGATMQESFQENFSPTSVAPLALRTAFGGGKLEYTLRPAAAVHLSFPLVLGYGEASADSLNEVKNNNSHHENGSKNDRNDAFRGNYAVIQPGINLEANLMRNVKVFAGANYRFAPKVGSSGASLPADVLQGASFGAGVKVGIFNFPTAKFRRGGRKMLGGGGKSAPTEVSAAFRKKFPAAPADVDFHKERNGEWEAEFEQNGKETSANFAADGRWLETETEVTAAALPAALQTTLQTTKKVRKIERIEKADGTVLFEVETRCKELIFNREGILILN